MMRKMALYFSFPFLLVMATTAGSTFAKSSEMTYRVRAPKREATVTLDAEEFKLTHSDDGRSKGLVEFFLDIFETNGELDEGALVVVRGAMNKFLLTEFNAIYEPQSNDLDAVSTEINGVAEIPPENKNGSSRRLNNKRGSEILMKVILSFDNEPSPSVRELEVVAREVMSDLSYFVTNLTALDYAGSGLESVTEAYRREIPTGSPTQSPVAGSDSSQGTANQSVQDAPGRNIATKAVPSLMLGATLIVLALYFIFKNKNENEPESPKNERIFVGVENDLYSMDRSLGSAQTPGACSYSLPGDSIQQSVSLDGSQMASPTSPTSTRSPITPRSTLSPNNGDSVFSGIDSPTSPSKGTKSLLSGFTNASSSTIQVSNRNGKRVHSTPKNLSMAAHGSLFAFSEEGYHDDDEDLTLRFRDDSPKESDAPSLTKSDVSDGSDDARRITGPTPSEESSTLHGVRIEEPTHQPQQNASVGQRLWCGVGGAATAAPPPGSPSHVLEDLARLASSQRDSPRDPTPTARRASSMSARDPSPRVQPMSYNIFSCNPSYAEPISTPKASEAMNPVSDLVLDGNSPYAAAGLTPQRPEDVSTHYPQSVSSTMPTPLKRNSASASTPKSPGSGQPHKTPNSQKSSKSANSAKSPYSVDSPGSVGMMAGRASGVIGEALAAEGGGTSRSGNRSRSSTIDSSKSGGRASRHSTPNRSRSSTPTKGRMSQPSTPPQSDPAGSRWINSRLAGRLVSTPPQEGDYVQNLSRPSTPGDDNDSSLHVSDFMAGIGGCMPFRGRGRKSVGANAAAADDIAAQHPALPNLGGNDAPGQIVFDGVSIDGTSVGGTGRRHAGNKLGGDGSAMYQTNAMRPLDWSYKSADNASVGDSTLSENEDTGLPRKFMFGGDKRDPRKKSLDARTVTSAEGSVRTGGSTKNTRGTRDTRDTSSQSSPSRQLINDLVWLEQKIADNKHQGTSSSVVASAGGDGGRNDPRAIDTTDSLSYGSNDNDAFISASSRDDGDDDDDVPTVYTSKNDSVVSSIVCRDCYAPPGKLHIVIHSTKDGPAVHTVKEGSSLEGHVFPGDLIISVDNVDTRSFTAEQVMNMMASKSDRERKITVLHFEEETS